MKIAYIANHEQSNADDEGAIAHALRVLGHEIECIQENDGGAILHAKCDLALFHKWYSPTILTKIKDRCKTAFWYFDRVHDDDPACQKSCAVRAGQVGVVLSSVTCGFMTDGDYVAAMGNTNLHVLRQGFDERLVTPFTFDRSATRVLFTGNGRWSKGRQDFVKFIHDKVGTRLLHVESGLYREGLRVAIRGSAVVLAPDAPGSDRYWSNRIYNVLGSGGLILHPSWDGLHDDGYQSGTHYIGYTRLEQVPDWIGLYDDRHSLREKLAKQGYDRTVSHNLYRHRVEQLLKIVQEA